MRSNDVMVVWAREIFLGPGIGWHIFWQTETDQMSCSWVGGRTQKGCWRTEKASWWCLWCVCRRWTSDGEVRRWNRIAQILSTVLQVIHSPKLSLTDRNNTEKWTKKGKPTRNERNPITHDALTLGRAHRHTIIWRSSFEAVFRFMPVILRTVPPALGPSIRRHALCYRVLQRQRSHITL